MIAICESCESNQDGDKCEKRGRKSVEVEGEEFEIIAG
jgi:hypothetical protein